MKRALFFSLAVTVLVGLTGCRGAGTYLSPHGRALIDGACGQCNDCPETCQSCDGCYDGCGDPRCEHCGSPRFRPGGRAGFDPGPPSAAITYPYYTIRGPRDFLARNPRNIGP